MFLKFIFWYGLGWQLYEYYYWEDGMGKFGQLKKEIDVVCVGIVSE